MCDYFSSKFHIHIIKRVKSLYRACYKRIAVIRNLPSAPFLTFQRQLLLTILAGSFIIYLRISK